MKALALALLGLVPSLTLAALCDDTYNLQTVNQSLYSGADPKNLTRTGKTVAPTFSNLDIISNSVNYKFISKFDGSCGKAAKAVTFRSRAAGASTEFTDAVDNTYQIQMFDSNTQVDKYKYDFWFGFYKPEDALVAYLGRNNAKSEAFSNFYAIVTFLDSVKDGTSGLWKVNSGYVGPSGPADSASLYDRLLDATQLKNATFDANHRAYFKVQMLEVKYENKPAPVVAIAAAKRPVSEFQTQQTGNLVLIRPGEKAAASGEALGLYGMMGNKIATLHPTGYVYQWNGKTASGADAPTGVYFVQSGNRILGKFFYSR